MPKYQYLCLECGYEFEKEHSIHTKERECGWCKSLDSLKRLPQDFNLKNENKEKKDAGKRVEQGLKEIEETMKQEKERFRNRNLWNG